MRTPRMAGTAQDVTERQRVEEVRDNILSAVSHELRTPLTSVLGFALTQELHPGDFLLRSDGVCRLNPQLARRAVQLVPPS